MNPKLNPVSANDAVSDFDCHPSAVESLVLESSMNAHRLSRISCMKITQAKPALKRLADALVDAFTRYQREAAI